MKINLSEHHASMVVAGVAEFVAQVDTSKYDRLKPIDGKLIIKPFKDKPEENVSEGGLVLLGEKDAQYVGVVVAVGSGAYNPYQGNNFPVNVSVGDLVFFKEHFGHEFIFGSERETLVAMDQTDLIGKAV